MKGYRIGVAKIRPSITARSLTVKGGCIDGCTSELQKFHPVRRIILRTGFLFPVQNPEVIMLTLDMIYKAQHVLKEVIRSTDLIKAPKINPQADVYLKTENLQITGSFKVRGA